MQSLFSIDYPGAESFMLLFNKAKSYRVLKLQQAWCYFFWTVLRGLFEFLFSKVKKKVCKV